MNALSRIESIDPLFPDVFRRFGRMPMFREPSELEIRIDVTENDKTYDVRAEIPGARKEDIRVSVDGNFVSITAEVRRDKEEGDKAGRVLTRETFVGSATRGFTLGHDIDAAGVKAKLENGVLKLALPKRAGLASRYVAIE